MSRAWRRVKSRDTRAVPFGFLECKRGSPHSCSRGVKLRVSPHRRRGPNSRNRPHVSKRHCISTSLFFNCEQRLISSHFDAFRRIPADFSTFLLFSCFTLCFAHSIMFCRVFQDFFVFLPVSWAFYFVLRFFTDSIVFWCCLFCFNAICRVSTITRSIEFRRIFFTFLPYRCFTLCFTAFSATLLCFDAPVTFKAFSVF